MSVPVPREDFERAGGLGEGEAGQDVPRADVWRAAAGVLRLRYDGLQDHPWHPGRARRAGEGRGAHRQDPGGAGPDLRQDRETRHLR